jgi:hypothetical protein
MKAQRMAWDYSSMGCLEGSMLWCGSRRSVRPIGERTLDQRQRLTLQPAYPPLSSPKTQRIAHAHGRLCVQPAAYDHPMHRRTRRWTNQRIDANTLCPPRSTLAALVLQRPSSKAALRRMSACGWAKCSLRAHSARDVQRSAPPETPGGPRTSAV